MYNSKDITVGWDGTYKGQLVSKGSYVYIINYIGDDNYSKSKKGTITVIK